MRRAKPILRQDLPDLILAWPDPATVSEQPELPPATQDGVYAAFYPGGALRCVAGVWSGKIARILKVDEELSRGSDSGEGAAWCDYLPGGWIETGSHFDDDSPARKTPRSCRSWALSRIKQMTRESPGRPWLCLHLPPIWERLDPGIFLGPTVMGIQPSLLYRGGLFHGSYHPWLCGYLGLARPPLVEEVLQQAIAVALAGVVGPVTPRDGLTVAEFATSDLALCLLWRAFPLSQGWALMLGAYPQGDHPKTQAAIASMMLKATIHPELAAPPPRPGGKLPLWKHV